MAVQILRLRSNLLYDRVFPSRLGDAELAINTNPGEPGLYFRDSSASPNIIKVGPIHVSATAPNLAPTGYAGLGVGESWLDQSSTAVFKIYDGSTWQTPKAVISNDFGKPINPIDGQLHYDKAVSGLFMYDAASTGWIPV